MGLCKSRSDFLTEKIFFNARVKFSNSVGSRPAGLDSDALDWRFIVSVPRGIITRPERSSVNADIILPASIGPFHFDHKNKTVTLDKGMYHLRTPITFGVTDETKIENIHYEGEAKWSMRDSPNSVIRGNSFS